MMSFLLPLLILSTLNILPLSAALAEPIAKQRIFIVGDSTASSYHTANFPRMGWGQVLESYFTEQITVVNLAKSGRSAKSYISEGHLNVLARDLAAGDILLIQFGHNDQKLNSPERYAAPMGAYQAYLKRYIDLANERQAQPVLLTSVVRRKFAGNKLIPTHGPYPDAVRTLARATQTPLIDINKLSRTLVEKFKEEPSKRLFLHFKLGETHLSKTADIADNTHFSERGAYAIAALVAKQLVAMFNLPPNNILNTKHEIRFVGKEPNDDFNSIQAAINSLPNNKLPALIMIKPGIFNEKLYLKRDKITLIGAGRDQTLIRFAELRANWRKAQPDDWGAGVVNIKASDIGLLQLSVDNPYGNITGDHGHQFALRLMSGTRLFTEDCSITAAGGDTLSPWNKIDGMYYHRRCHFAGYTDFICPRGWSYVTDSSFYSYGGAAAIWHDGERNKNQKFVIRDSQFDGVKGFILGRRHYDAQFYLLNNHFSENMADQAIFRKTYDDKSRNKADLWGDRTYFYRAKKAGKPFQWLTTNVTEQDSNITVSQVFDGRWDPEQDIVHIKVLRAMADISGIPPQ